MMVTMEKFADVKYLINSGGVASNCVFLASVTFRTPLPLYSLVFINKPVWPLF